MSDPFRPFTSAPAATIPIVGQAFEIKNWWATIVLMCRCGAHEPIVILGQLGARGTCPACKKTVICQGIRTTPPNNAHFDFGIELGASNGVVA